jgi:acyl-CoA hydrolase
MGCVLRLVVAAVEVDRITFERPVNVGDLIKFRSWVTSAWPCQHTPGKVGLHG